MTTATEAYDAAGGLVPPKRILVNNRPIQFRWVQQVIASFVAANIGTLVIVAVYYLLVQVKWPGIGGHTILYLKPDWDRLFAFQQWPADRHDIRDVYEAVLATLFVKSLLANWKKSRRVAPAWYVAISPLVIIAAAAPIVIGGVFLINHAGPELWHHALGHRVLGNPVHMPQRLAWLGTYLAGFPWQPAAIGIFAGLVVHRVYAPAGNTVQLYFVGRAVDRARDALGAGEGNPERHLPHWPAPPVVRERAWWIWVNGLEVPDRTGSIAAAVTLATLALLALAGLGGYVKYVVAKGH